MSTWDCLFRLPQFSFEEVDATVFFLCLLSLFVNVKKRHIKWRGLAVSFLSLILILHRLCVASRWPFYSWPISLQSNFEVAPDRISKVPGNLPMTKKNKLWTELFSRRESGGENSSPRSELRNLAGCHLSRKDSSDHRGINCIISSMARMVNKKSSLHHDRYIIAWGK